MGILADWQIKRDIGIKPFAEGEKRHNTISYGLSSYGYDMRLGYKFRVVKPYPDAIIDPKKFREDMYEQVEREEYIDIPAHSFVLGESIEEFNIPRDVLCIVMGKSTYARCGLYVNVTPGEPEWIGKWTIELSNTTPKTVRVYCGEGICQCLFLRTDGHSEAVLNAVRRLCGTNLQQVQWSAIDSMKELVAIEQLLYTELGKGSCEKSYADKKGKYQNQDGMTNPTVDKRE